MTLPPITAETAKQLADRLLDRGYDAAAGQVIRAITNQTANGLMAQRLKEFEAECKRIQEAGEKLSASNPVYRALVADMETTLKRQAGLMDAAAPDVQAIGLDAGTQLARALTLPGLNDQQLARVGIAWAQPDPEAIARVIEIVNSGAWANELATFGDDILDVMNNIIIRGIIGGQNPLTTARQLRETVETLPAWKANSLLRTLQLGAYRSATAASYVANADIIEYQVRIEAKDDRVCMACVLLDGTRLEVGEVVDEHYNGRGTSVAVVKGRELDIERGEDRFLNMSEDEQRTRMGDATFNAWKAGDIQLSDLIEHRTDPIFGAQIAVASLQGMLGKAAEKHYKTAS